MKLIFVFGVFFVFSVIAVLSVFIVSVITFFVMHAIPGGPFDRVGDKSLPPSVRANLEAKYGLDKPLAEQFFTYIFDVLQGDLGPSFSYRGRTVNQIIAQTFPISLQLGILSIMLALIIGIPAGDQQTALWQRVGNHQ